MTYLVLGLITIPVAHSATKLYNGNISETEWRTANTDNSLKWYKYYYYALNRITKAYGGTGTGDNGDKFNLGSSSIPTTYDLNGNITHLFRRGAIVASPSLSNNNHFGSMDNLIYKYQGTSNKLQRIEENNGNDNYGFLDHSTASTEYTYDLNGNLKTDANKDITSITYNHLNLPTSIIFNGSSSQKIEYFYDANGIKLKKRVNDNGSVTETLHAGNFIYRGGSFDFYFHPEGYVEKENNAYKYYYQYKDHLGNIRVSYDNSGSVSSPNASIVEEHNYYPFGLEHTGYNNVVSSNANSVAQKVKYNGKELEQSLGYDVYDYEARHYDPAIGRWLQIDPLAEQMRRHSTYNFAFDNPIYWQDPDGMAPQGPNDVITKISNTRKVGNQVRRDIKMTVTVSVVNLTGADLSKTMFSGGSGTVRLKNFEGNTMGYDTNTQTNIKDNITEFNINYKVVTSLDDIRENDHVLLISEKINGDSNASDVTESTVGLADRPGRVSTVEDGTIADGNFDEVAQHELGHNLGLEHSELNDLMFETVNGNKSLSQKKKGDIVGGQIDSTQGNGTVKESSTYKTTGKKEAETFIFLNEIDFKKK